MAQGENMIESARGGLLQDSEEELGDLSCRLHGSFEEDNSKRQLPSAVAQDLICFFFSIIALK